MQIMENVYIELRKLFAIRKNYLGIPVKAIQKEIADITREDILTFTAEDIELPKKNANNVVRMGFCG